MRTTHIVITILQNKPLSAASLVYSTPNTTHIGHILLPMHAWHDRYRAWALRLTSGYEQQ